MSSAKLASSLRKSEPPGSQKAAGSTKLSLCIPRVLCSAEAQPFCRASTLGCAGTASYVHRTNRMFSFLPSPITTRFKRQGRRQDAQERAVLLSSCLTSLFFAGFSNLLLTRGWYMIKIKPSDGAPPVRTRLNAVILHCACNEKRERHGVARSTTGTCFLRGNLMALPLTVTPPQFSAAPQQRDIYASRTRLSQFDCVFKLMRHTLVKSLYFRVLYSQVLYSGIHVVASTVPTTIVFTSIRSHVCTCSHFFIWLCTHSSWYS